VLAQLVAQLIVAEAEGTGGQALIVTVSGQRILQELALESGDGLAEPHRAIRLGLDGTAFRPGSSRIAVEARRFMERWRRAER
jgi:hypothetical protein